MRLPEPKGRVAVRLVAALWFASCGGTHAPPQTPNTLGGATAGLDTHDLTPRELHELERALESVPAPCAEVATPLSRCITEARPCSRCSDAANSVLKSVRDGLSPEQIESAYKSRFGLVPPVQIDEAGSPKRGPEKPTVTIVEFADFECPHCGAMAPELDAVWEKHKDQVLFVYKFYPIQYHAHGELSARAGIAAFAQGKFWEMHHKMFAHQHALEQRDLDGYAKELGLDIERFHSDMQSKETGERIARDRALADSLHVTGTPAIFVNGHPFDTKQKFDERIETELGSRTP